MKTNDPVKTLPNGMTDIAGIPEQFCPFCGEGLSREELHEMVVTGLCPACSSKYTAGLKTEVTK